MTLDKTGAQTTVTDVSNSLRYEISVGDQLAGFTEYRERENNGVTERIFFHTEIDEQFGGRGLATILISEALADTINQRTMIIGVCPLVAAFLTKHHELEAHTRPVTDEVVRWLTGHIN